MTAIAYYLLKVIVCSGILFLYYHLALRNKLFHQWNRFYLLAVVVLSLVVPLMEFTFLQQETADDTIRFLTIVQSADNYMEEIYIRSSGPMSAEQWMGIGYVLITIVLLSSLALSVIRIYSIIRRHEIQWVDKIKFIPTQEKGTPFSFFRYIFWNEKIDLDSEAGRQIFQHELVHVKEAHSLDKIFMQLILAVFWCNPIFWLLRRELQLIHEFIADKKAVQQHDTAAFAAMILQSAYAEQFSTITNSFFQSSIKRRLLMLTKIQDPRITYASRILALPLIALVVLAFSFRTKAADVPNPISDMDPMYVGIASDTLPRKSVKEINKIDVDKQKGRITITYQDGETITLSVEEAKQKNLIRESNNSQSKNPTIRTQKGEQFQIEGTKSNPLYYVDGKEFTGDLNKIDPSTIKSINVLKDRSAVAKYGDKGKNGVVEIITKAGKVISDTIPKNEPVFEKAEVEASVDLSAWRKFLEMNLQSVIESVASKGMPPGQYTVNMRFIIKKDGSLTDFTALNDPGYGLVQKVLEIIPNSPKWKPAEQNGRPVNSYHTQPITFVISEGSDSKEKNNSGNTYPNIGATELKLKAIHDLIWVNKADEIVSFTMTVDLDNGGTKTMNHSGNQYTTADKYFLDQYVKPGHLMTIDRILVKIDGALKKIPGKVYFIRS